MLHRTIAKLEPPHMIALLDTSKDPKALAADVAAAWRAPIGAASPLWLMFAGATSMGVAFWWMNRWRAMAPTHLEAVLTPPAPERAVEAVAEAIKAPVIEATEAVEEVIEAAPEPALEAAPEPVLEAAPEPVVEAAPEPVVEAAAEVEAAPKPKAPAKAKPKAADA
jgi:hypothetical protein